jgi:glycosyltransferase involved in cell wall biosynthesis
MNRPHIMIFDVSGHQHYPMFVRCWLESWIKDDRRGQLTLVVTPHFLRTYPHLSALAAQAPHNNIHLVPPAAEEMAVLKAVRAQTDRLSVGLTALMRDGDSSSYGGLQFWEVFTNCAHRLGADLSVMGSIENYLPLLSNGVSGPDAVAGILFGTVFHYEQLLGAAAVSERNRFEALQQRFLLARALEQPRLKRLLFTDRYAVAAADVFEQGEKVHYLPEPALVDAVEAGEVENIRRDLGIEPARRVLAMLGSQSDRKGLDIVVEGLLRLPLEMQRSACLLISGPPGAGYQRRFNTLLERIRAYSAVQVIHQPRELSDTQFSTLLHLSDVVLTLYRDHPGMSNITLVAGAAKRPVLCADYGLMGQITREYGLGITVNIHDDDAVTAALCQSICAPDSLVSDTAQRQRMMSGHHPTAFGRACFNSFYSALG